MTEVVASGIVYRNSKPYLRAIHAWHPSIVRLPSGELLASFDLGQAVEGLDYRTYLARSIDGGESWSIPWPLAEDPSAGITTTHSVRISQVADGTLLAFGGRFYRHDPDEGLVNRENLGYVPMELILLRSHDGGRKWNGPEVITSPIAGPGFETCHRIIELADGRWLAPTSTWRGWNGDCPHGMQAVALVSYDRGHTWPEWLPVVNQYDQGIISWEQSLVQLPDGRLLAVVWCFDEERGTSLPNRYALSDDGRRFGPPRENGLLGETAKLLTLEDGRILCLYRRTDRPGLWGCLARIEGDAWVTLDQAPLWRGPASGMAGTGPASDELSGLKFGFPSMTLLPSGEILALFWCVEECQHVIRWQRLRLAGEGRE
ncbi:MAG: sialidase family protein [Planctomycetales bacterium]